MLFFFQAKDGIRDLVRSRGLGDVYKRQGHHPVIFARQQRRGLRQPLGDDAQFVCLAALPYGCLLYTSDAADERSSVDLGGRRIIKKKKTLMIYGTYRF